MPVHKIIGYNIFWHYVPRECFFLYLIGIRWNQNGTGAESGSYVHRDFDQPNSSPGHSMWKELRYHFGRRCHQYGCLLCIRSCVLFVWWWQGPIDGVDDSNSRPITFLTTKQIWKHVGITRCSKTVFGTKLKIHQVYEMFCSKTFISFEVGE